MPKSKAEVVAEAHRRIGVLSVDEDPSDDMTTYAGDAADSLLVELNSPPHSMGFYWTTETVPDAVFRPFAWLLAVDLAVHYQVQAEGRKAALFRIRQYASPDDRESAIDYDLDGELTDEEREAAKRAVYF